MKFDYSWMPGSFVLVDSALLEECAALYSSHYGRWGGAVARRWQAGAFVGEAAPRVAGLP